MTHIVEVRLDTLSAPLAPTDPEYDRIILAHARETLRFVQSVGTAVAEADLGFRSTDGYRGASCDMNLIARSDILDICWVEHGPAVHVLPSWHIERTLAKLDSEDAETIGDHLARLADLVAEALRRKLEARDFPIRRGRRRDIGQLQQISLDCEIDELHRQIRAALDTRSAFELALRP